MRHEPDRFLGQHMDLARGPVLGRVFNVTRETWRLSDDPIAIAPQTELLSSRHTASEAADLARAAAEAFRRHGFHKPSGGWWGADETYFHRFVVRPGRRRAAVAVVIASGLLGVAAVALSRRRGRA